MLEAETIDKLVITPADFAADYKRGGEMYERYLNWLKDPSARDRQARYWRMGMQPSSVKGIARLHALGVFAGKEVPYQYHDRTANVFDARNIENFDINNPLFELACFLVSLIYWVGGRHKAARKECTYYQSILHYGEPNKHILGLIHKLSDEGWLSLIQGEGERDDQFGKLTSEPSRLVGILGAQSGRKATAQDVIPRCIRAALNATEESLPDNVSDTALRIIRDFMNIFWVTRGTTRRNGQIDRCLNAQKSQLARRRLRGVMRKICKAVGYTDARMRYTDASSDNGYGEDGLAYGTVVKSSQMGVVRTGFAENELSGRVRRELNQLFSQSTTPNNTPELLIPSK
jgi:hypothetical protein